MIIYKQTQLVVEEIYNYLERNEQLFIPPLKMRLDIRKYSKKLQEFALHFCAFNENYLVGFAACYFNDTDKSMGFISSVSVVKEFQGCGILSNLLSQIINYGIKKHYTNLRLEVNVENRHAFTRYQKTGFEEIAQKNNIITMELKLGGKLDKQDFTNI